jgi:hypothetical protein
MEKHHLLFNEIDYIVDVLSVATDKLFLLFEDHFHQAFVIVANTVHV